MVPSNARIIEFFSARTAHAGFVDKLKIKYRPIICPFQDLLEIAANADSVFDIGCGSGQFCALLAAFTPVQRIMGIEISETLVRNAEEINAEFKEKKDIRFAVFDGKSIPEAIGEYDLVFMIDVYHHIPKESAKTFMQDVHRKMKRGARLMFKDINAASPLVVCNKLHDLVFSREIGSEISAGTARAMLEKTGFRIVQDYRKTVAVYPHYFLLAEKQ